MKILWKVIWKEIRQKPGRFAALVTGMTAAVFLITVVTAFSNSCLQSMIRQEKEENGPYEAVFHNLTRGQARRLAENDQIRETYKLTDCKEGDTQEGRNCYGTSFQKISLSIFERSQDVGVEIGMDVVPLEEQKVLFSRPNWSVTSSFDITFNEKLLGYYGINAAGVTAGSAWAIALIDGVIVLFAAALLYYVVLSGLEEKLKTHPAVEWLGRVSYAVYLVHMPYGSLLLTLLAPRLGYTISFAATLALVLGAVSLVRTVLFAALGIAMGFPGGVPWSRFAWFTLITWGVSMVLFFLQQGLSLRFANQAIPLICGIFGSFAGLLSLLFPVGIQRVIPWGYYGLMSLAGMDWDEATRFTAFYWRVPEPLDVGLLLVWGIVFLMVGRTLFVRKEV